MDSGGRRARIGLASFAAVAAVIAALLVPAAQAPAAGAGIGDVYVALGDSYTSGPLVPNQHGSPIDCGRSDHNYPSLIAAEFKPATFIDVSCGSAETKHMTEPQTGLPAGGTNPPQFDALRADATLVTVGIGGNDAGLVGVAEECAQLGITAPNGTACRDHYAPGGNDTVAAKIEATKPKIAAILETIHERSPNARVAIFGYPDVLPDSGNCYPTVPLSPDDVRYIDELIIRINAMIAGVAAKHEADFVDTYADSGGHDVCKLPPTRWFEGLVPTEPAFPLHPNAKGLASMARSGSRVLSQPSASAPLLYDLKVRPKRVRKGRPAKVIFKTDRPSEVQVSFESRSKGSPARAGAVELEVGEGPHKLKLRPRSIGRKPARFRISATATSAGLTGEVVKARFRIVKPKG
jgi:lysophospholipase L1-like esterase